MRLCIDLGLHRRSSSTEITLEGELNKRIFWSCYYLDREISGALGLSELVIPSRVLMFFRSSTSGYSR